jgi:hypothetical protein
MPACRICGALCSTLELRGVESGGGCVSCSGSPNCADCGHPRNDHAGTFTAGAGSGCSAPLYDIQSLTVSSCTCTGFAASR